ncbi:MAG: molybdopterin-binding protein [Gammaproteobacteria bacterium]|jgi:molybdenum cofactor cytidylyltransferase
MKFGEVPVSEATGAVLAHSIRLEGARIGKGKPLDARDVALLEAAGIRTVVVARFDDDDIAEDAAAARVAQALEHRTLLVEDAKTGRANISSRTPGLCLVDAEAIHRMNAVHESITVATVAPHAPVAAGQIVATVKIIPFAVEREPLDAVVAIARLHRHALTVQPFIPRTVGVIFSELPAVPFRGREKAERVLSERLDRLGGNIDRLIECQHETAALAPAIRELVAHGADLILLFGASAIVDRGDVIPAALECAGGEIRHFGMPVEPGNMLLLGRLGQVDIVGLPGCARSPKLNGFDWVLQRLFAGLPLTGDDISSMGVGGLLV